MRGFAFHLSRRQETRAVDRVMGVAAFIQPLTATPQLWSIYSTHNVSGVSVLTWALFMVFGLVFFLLGISEDGREVLEMLRVQLGEGR